MAELVEGGSPCSSLKVAQALLGSPCSFFCSVILSSLLVVLGCLLIGAGLLRNSEKLGFPTFAALGKGRQVLRNSLKRLMGGSLFLPEVSLPRLTGEMLAEVVHRKGAAAGSLVGWGWREFKALPVSWFGGLARIFSKVEDVGVWPEGLLDACIAMIPKTDGDPCGFVQIWFPQLLFFSVSLILLLLVLEFLLIQPRLVKNSERLGFPTFAALGKGRPALTNSALRLMGGCRFYLRFIFPG